MGKYFGTDGFRGEANKVLTVEHAYKVGRYLGWYFGRNNDNVNLCMWQRYKYFFKGVKNRIISFGK